MHSGTTRPDSKELQHTMPFSNNAWRIHMSRWGLARATALFRAASVRIVSMPNMSGPDVDIVSERLRRWTRNPLGSARRGSNPLAVAFAMHSLPLDPHGHIPATSRDLARKGSGVMAGLVPVVLACESPFQSRQCVRAAKEMDSKSIGLCPQGFESPRCRLITTSAVRALLNCWSRCDGTYVTARPPSLGWHQPGRRNYRK